MIFIVLFLNYFGKLPSWYPIQPCFYFKGARKSTNCLVVELIQWLSQKPLENFELVKLNYRIRWRLRLKCLGQTIILEEKLSTLTRKIPSDPIGKSQFISIFMGLVSTSARFALATVILKNRLFSTCNFWTFYYCRKKLRVLNKNLINTSTHNIKILNTPL